jgi:hypothetical protein
VAIVDLKQQLRDLQLELRVIEERLSNFVALMDNEALANNSEGAQGWETKAIEQFQLALVLRQRKHLMIRQLILMDEPGIPPGMRPS